MSSKIDERVVELKFNTKQFEQGVKSTSDNLDKLNKSLQMDGAKKGITELQGAVGKFSLKNISDGVSEVASKFGALSIIGITALANLTSKAIDAGLQIAKSLTIAPIADGFAEYELKMGSVQTIMAGTGESLQTVSKYLEDLNRYADRTIYSFADMTSNIGKFTNAGVGLDQAVAAIQGISNVAALSGANANEASRAMYNFSQAISSGYVKLIDWKSIEMANMATAEFKTQLLEGAVAAGTLTKGVDGMYTTLKGVPVSATKGFNESLEEQWMTTEVLTATLGKYSDETTDIGKRAFAAAQDVKTFTQMMDTMKEAVGSGWAQTFEIVLGDFDEAKKLWTGVNDVVGGFINETSDLRNKILQGWADLGGRTVVIDAISNAFKALVSVLKPVTDAFANVFPPITSQMLYDASVSLGEFAKGLVLSEKAAERLTTVFKGIFSAIKLVLEIAMAWGKVFLSIFGGAIRIIGAILSLFTPLIDFFTELDKKTDSTGGQFLTLADRISSLIDRAVTPLVTLLGNLRTAIDELIKSKFGGFVSNMEDGFDPLEALGNNIYNVWSKLKDFFQKAWDFIKPIANQIGEFFADFGAGVSAALGGIDFGLVLGAANTGILAYLAVALSNLFKSGSGALKGISGIFKGITGVFDELTGVLKAMQADLKAKALIKIAIAIGILAASMLVLSSIKPAAMGAAAAGMGTIVAALVGATVALDKFTTVKGAAKLPFIMAALIGLSAAILIMAVALKVLSSMSWDDIGRGLTALAGGLALMVGALVVLSSVSGRAFIAAQAMIAISTSMLILGMALKIFATMSWDEIGRGMTVFAGLLVGMVAALLVLSNVGPKVIIAAAAMIAVGIAINILAGAIAILGSMDTSTLVQGMIALGVVLLMMSAAIMLLSQNALGTAMAAVALIALSVALYMITGAIAMLGSMDMATLVQGIGALAVVLLILIGAMYIMTSAIAGAIAMAIVAGALLLLSVSIGILGAMPIEMLVQGLLALVAVFAIMGVAALLLAPLTPVLLALGVAIALTAVGMVLMAGAMMIFAMALGVFGANAIPAAVGLVVLAAAIVQIGPTLPLIAAAGIAFIAFGAGALIAGIGIAVLGVALIVLAGGLALIGVTAPMGVVALMLLAAAMMKIAPQALEFAAVGVAFIALGAGLVVLGAGALVAGLGLMVFGNAMKLMNSVGEKGATVLAKVVEKIAGLTDQAIKLGIMTVALAALGVALLALGGGAMLAGTGLLLFATGLMLATTASMMGSVGFTMVGNSIKKLEPAISTMAGIAAAVIMMGAGFQTAGSGGRAAAGGITAMVASSMLGSTAVRAMATTIMTMIPLAMAVMSTMGPSTAQTVTQVVTNFATLSRGISASVPIVNAAAAALVISMTSTVVSRLAASQGSVYNGGYYVGMAVSQGMAQGIRNNSHLVQLAADQVAAQALATSKARLGVHSPSREFEEIGMFSDKGLAKGFLGHIGLVVAASTKVADASLEVMKNAMASIADFMFDEIDTSPSIRPVMDLTGIKKDAASLSSLMGAGTIRTGASFQNAAQVSSDFNSARQSSLEDAAVIQNVTNLNYSQANYSPEALSQVEIYRQTKNQLASVKGALRDNANQGPSI